MYKIDNWVNEGSGWIIELIESQYINISTYRPLSESSYVKLPGELISLKKEWPTSKIKKYKKIKKYTKKELHGKIVNSC